MHIDWAEKIVGVIRTLTLRGGVWVVVVIKMAKEMGGMVAIRYSPIMINILDIDIHHHSIIPRSTSSLSTAPGAAGAGLKNR